MPKQKQIVLENKGMKEFWLACLKEPLTVMEVVRKHSLSDYERRSIYRYVNDLVNEKLAKKIVKKNGKARYKSFNKAKAKKYFEKKIEAKERELEELKKKYRDILRC